MAASSFGLAAADVDTSRAFQVLSTRRLFTAPAPLLATGWSLAPDDERFLFTTTLNGGRMAPFTVVLNWPATLDR